MTVGAVRASVLAVAFVVLFLLCPAARAASADICRVVADSIEVQVLFPIGESAIDKSFDDNGVRLDAFVEQL